MITMKNDCRKEMIRCINESIEEKFDRIEWNREHIKKHLIPSIPSKEEFNSFDGKKKENTLRRIEKYIDNHKDLGEYEEYAELKKAYDSLNEASKSHKGETDLQEVMELLKERLGVDVEFLGRNKNMITIGFEFSQKLKDETDKLSYSEQDRFEADLAEFLGDKVKEVFITNTKHGGSNIVLRVDDNFDVGVEYYDVNALIKNPGKAKEELKFDKLVEKICDKLGSNIQIRVYIDQRYRRKEAVENEAVLMIEARNLVDDVGIMKSIFDAVNIEIWNSWVRANPKNGSLEAYADIHLSWHNHDGGSNGAELCTAYFSDGRWTI